MEKALKKSEDIKHVFTVTENAQVIEDRENVRLLELLPNIQLPGFRSGKVPVGVAKQKFAKQMSEEVFKAFVEEAIDYVCKDVENLVQDSVNVNLQKYKQDDLIEIEVSYEVLPEIVLKSVEGFVLEKLEAEVTDDDLQASIDNFMRTERKWTDADADYAARNEDLIFCEAIAVIGDDEKNCNKDLNFPDGSFILGEPGVSSEIQDAAIGHKAGEDVCIEEYTLPSDEQCKLILKIKKIASVEKVSLDDAYAQSKGFENKDDFLQKMREKLENDNKEMSSLRLRKSFLDALDELYCDLEVPSVLVRKEMNAIWSHVSKEFQKIDEDVSQDIDLLKVDYLKIARRRVRLGLVLAEIGKREDISVSQEELIDALKEIISLTPANQVQDVIKFYQSNDNAIASVSAPIFEGKIIDILLKQCEVNVKMVPMKELYDYEDDIDIPFVEQGQNDEAPKAE